MHGVVWSYAWYIVWCGMVLYMVYSGVVWSYAWYIVLWYGPCMVWYGLMHGI